VTATNLVPGVGSYAEAERRLDGRERLLHRAAALSHPRTQRRRDPHRRLRLRPIGRAARRERDYCI
jgi:hypothetical protein